MHYEWLHGGATESGSAPKMKHFPFFVLCTNFPSYIS